MTTFAPSPLNRRQDLLLWWSAAAVSVTALLLAVWLLPRPVDHWPIPDLQVYREGVELLTAGGNPYSARLGIGQLPYTYPPFSLLVFLPLAVWVPKLQVIAVVNTLLLAMVIWAVLRSYPQTDRRTTAGLTASQAMIGSTILLGAQTLEPITNTTRFGQVNVVLMAMVVVDMLVVNPRWRGTLTGLAAMVKLTPLAFLAFPLWLRERSAARNLIGTSAVCLILSIVIMPRSTFWYFTDGMLAQDRPGATYPGLSLNQSLRGLSLRLVHPGALQQDQSMPTTTVNVVWLALVLLVIGLLLLALRGLDTKVDRALALGYIATAGLLVSPISWPHHWVWVVPLAAATVSSVRRFPLVAGAVGLMVVSMVGNPWFNGHWYEAVTLSPTAALLVLNPYVGSGLLVLAAGAWYGRRRRVDGD